MKWRSIALKALSSGASYRGGRLDWNVAGGCYAPVTREVWYWNKDQSQHRFLILETRCRKCEACLRTRRDLWRIRMRSEILRHKRNWFVTLTLDPARQSLCEMEAMQYLSRRSVNWSAADDTTRFNARLRPLSREVTLWLKRLRKAADGAPLRYCLVYEKHKSGLPHVHALIHEVDPDRPVRYRQLEKSWRWGFMQAKLVGSPEDVIKASNYVSKYLSKGLGGRVRASRGYGT